MVSIPSAYQSDVNTAAAATGLPAGVIAAQINAESGWQPGVSSSAGAQGIAQFIPSTWAGLHCAGSPFNAQDSFRCYAIYMKQLLAQFHGNVRDALAAYNAGPGNLAAGYGYADGILAAAGQPQSARSAPGNAPAGGSGSAGGVQTASIWTDITDPFTSVARSLGSIITNPWSIVMSVTRIATDFNSLVGLFNTFMRDIEWLFVPSHWVRIFCFIFGVGALIPGIWALVKTGSGQQGDITLAIGILLITIGGMLLFLAFHNLPTDVKDLGGLLGYISRGVQAGQAPAGVA